MDRTSVSMTRRCGVVRAGACVRRDCAGQAALQVHDADGRSSIRQAARPGAKNGQPKAQRANVIETMKFRSRRRSRPSSTGHAIYVRLRRNLPERRGIAAPPRRSVHDGERLRLAGRCEAARVDRRKCRARAAGRRQAPLEGLNEQRWRRCSTKLAIEDAPAATYASRGARRAPPPTPRLARKRRCSVAGPGGERGRLSQE